jgi:hypothetical protein
MLFRLLTAVAATAAAAFSSIVDCGGPGASFAITKLALRPDPPIPGLPVALVLEFTNNGPEVNAGTVATTITLNGLPYSDSKPLCDDTACPIVPGFNNRTSETTWPDITGKVVSTIRWSDAQEAELLCIQTTVRVGTGSLRGGGGDSTTTALMLPFYNQKHYHMAPANNSTMCAIFDEAAAN